MTNGSATDTTASIIGGILGGNAKIANFGTINGGIDLYANGYITNGSATDKAALISGAYIGVYAGRGRGVTVVNYGTIQGTAWAAVQLKNRTDRLIAEAGSTWVGSVQGGGGALELASGVGTISGFGAIGKISGAEAMTFIGFGSYTLDTGTSWTLSGINTIGAAQGLTLARSATLVDNSGLSSNGALSLSGTVSGSGSLTISDGTAAINSGAAVSVATISLTGGTTSLIGSLTFDGAFSENAGATLTLGSKVKLSLSGTSNLGGLINGAGTVTLANATVSSLTIGGTDTLSVTGSATQTGAVTIGDATTAAAILSIAKGATWTINGAVGIARGASTGSSLSVAGKLIKVGATGTSTINLATADSGLIEVTAGTLDFANLLTGTGTLEIGAGATLEADSTVTSTLTATFKGRKATLALQTPTVFTATISGLAISDTIDLLKIAATGAKINGKDQLVIVNGSSTVATLQLTGTYSKAKFTIGPDGNGGTDVTLLKAASVPPPTAAPLAFVGAMAGLGGGGSGSLASTASAAVSVNAIRLLTPESH